MAIVTLEDLLRCLELVPGEAGHFRAPNLPQPERRLYGGQLLAQGIAIGARVGGGPVDAKGAKSVKSAHATFLREGDPAEPVDFRAESVHAGRSFASVAARGVQKRGPIAAWLISLHAPEGGIEHQLEAPREDGPEAARPVDLPLIPWETRMADGVDLASQAGAPPQLKLWMRAPRLPDDPVIHQALLAAASDLTVIETALLPHAGLSATKWPSDLQSAVTSHTVWFHRPFRLDDWLLIAQQSPVAAGARAFGTGHVFTRQGVLVASFAQESLIRVLEAEPPPQKSRPMVV